MIDDNPRPTAQYTTLDDLLDEDGIREEVETMAREAIAEDARNGRLKNHAADDMGGNARIG